MSSEQWKKERGLYFEPDDTGAYLVLTPTLSQLRSWLWRPANPAIQSPTEGSQVWGSVRWKERQIGIERLSAVSVASDAEEGQEGEGREARWTSERWKRSRRWRRYGRKANERVVPWKELVQNPGNPIRGPRDTGHPATNWNSSVAAEARLSIIET